MKKHLLLVSLVFFYACGKGQIATAKNGQDFEGVISRAQADLIFENTRKFPDNTEVAIALIAQGEPIFYGVKRLNDTLRTETNHQKVFEIGSISKVFTATILADMVIEEKLALEDEITAYLEVPLKGEPNITFRQLASHTSGLPRLPTNMQLFANPSNPYKNYSEEKLRAYLTEHLSVTNPGTKYEYSNLGAGLLGYLLVKIDGSNYEELLKRRVLEKHAMESTTVDRSKVEQMLVRGLGPKGKEVPNWDLNALVAAGGILSSVEDLSKFVMAQFDQDNKVLALTREPVFEINNGLAVGLGWHIGQSASGNQYFRHSGGTGGYRSCMVVDTKNKNAVIILSNVSAFGEYANRIDDLCQELIKTLE